MKIHDLMLLIEADMSPYVLSRGARGIDALVGIEIEGVFSLERYGGVLGEDFEVDVSDLRTVDELRKYFLIDASYGALEQYCVTRYGTKRLAKRGDQLWQEMLESYPDTVRFLADVRPRCHPRYWYSRNDGKVSLDLDFFSDVSQSRKLMYDDLIDSDFGDFIDRVTTDTSIVIDDEQATSFTAEIVTDPIPYRYLKKYLIKLFAWLRDNFDFVTNDSTGCHINVSINGRKDIDFAKLFVFLGEEHELRKHGRLGNKYANSHIDALSDDYDSNIPSDVKQYIGVLNDQISSTGKYYSFNIGHWDKLHYIEFRIAGGDYSNNMSEVFASIDRYVNVMDIATDPAKYQKEYYKKVAKVGGNMLKNREYDGGAKASLQLKVGFAIFPNNATCVNRLAKTVKELVRNGSVKISQCEITYVNVLLDRLQYIKGKK